MILKSCWFWLSLYYVKFSGSYSWFIFQPRKGCCTEVDKIGSKLFPQLLVSVLFLVLNTCDLVDIYYCFGVCATMEIRCFFFFVVIFRSRLLLPVKKHYKIIAHGIAWYIYLRLVDYFVPWILWVVSVAPSRFSLLNCDCDKIPTRHGRNVEDQVGWQLLSFVDLQKTCDFKELILKLC